MRVPRTYEEPAPSNLYHNNPVLILFCSPPVSVATRFYRSGGFTSLLSVSESTKCY